MEYSKFTFLTKVLVVLLTFCMLAESHAFETKVFDLQKPNKNHYLVFSKPIPLRYSTTPLPVDRKKLISPTLVITALPLIPDNNSTDNNVITSPSLPVNADDNSTANETGSFPVFPTISKVVPTKQLPLTDPFLDADSVGINTTDQLLDVFESSSFDGSRSGIQSIPFIPPYTIAPDNMRVSTRATYTRRQR